MAHLNLHPSQSTPFEDLFVKKVCRHSVVVASRGYGKSFLAASAGATAAYELMELDHSVPNKNVYIVAPTYTQVTDIYYPLLAYQMGFDYFKNSKDMGIFWLPGNVVLKLVSFEAIERLRGTGAYFVVNDEPSSCTKGIGFKAAWEGVIQPCIVTRWSKERAKAFGAKSPGRSLTIGTPKGYNYLYDMYHFEETDEEWKSYHYDYRDSPYLDEAEIERIKHTIDPIEFNSEYLATFEDSGNNVFYCFDRKIHVVKDLPYFYPPEGPERGEDVHVAIDFNVGIQATSAWAMRGQKAYCLDEFKGHPDTDTLAKVLTAKYKGHRIIAYPDPSGNSRKTSAAVGTTDFTILQSYGINVLARDKAPPIVDSVASVNKKLKNAAGDIDVYISPECVGTITSLERTTWVDKNPDLAVIDKSAGVEHFSDGVRYMFEYRFPVNAGRQAAHRGFNF